MGDGDNRLGEYLRARRELVRPVDVGMPDGHGRRRVPGLRREEVAMLAGVSADYYIRLEQGRDKHPSEPVIESIARVLGLDDDAVAHLHELARPVSRRRRTQPRPERVSPGAVRLIESWSFTPAVVVGRCLDVLAVNPLGAALNSCQRPGANQVRSFFLDPVARDVFPEWESIAADVVASLRAAAGRDLDDPRLTELVGELSLKSELFRQLWARHDVRVKMAGTKTFRHPMVGDLVLAYETLAVTSAPGQLVIAWHAEPGSPSEQALALLSTTVSPSVGDPASAGRRDL